MSTRHILQIKNGDKVVLSEQIIGNNDFFDEEFYENMRLNLDDYGELEETEISIEKLFSNWYKWLIRHPEKTKLPDFSGILNNDAIKDKDLYLYQGMMYPNIYVVEPFLLIQKMRPFLINLNENFNKYGKLREKYKAFLSIY